MDYRSAERLRLICLRLLSTGLVVVLLFLSLLSANDALHRSFHHGDRQGASPCAVCLLVKGHLESPAVAPIVLILPPQQVDAPPAPVSVQPAFAFLSTPTRAPPVSTAFVSGGI